MKKIAALALTLFAVALSLFADEFTDIIQDLAAQTACLGVYSATQAGGGWYEDPYDYYTPQMMAQRFARMSGKKTRTETFYGVCFDYAEYAYNDIERYLDVYNECGMEGKQYYIAGVFSNYNQITLQWPVKASEADTTRNGISVKMGKQQGVKTHRLRNTGARATDHAWLWIQRDDGVWFWIDPTWTDNVGYVVWGCVYNGEEVQLKPDPALCIVYPSYLNSLPSAPPRGSKTPVPAPQVAQVQPTPRPSPSPSPSPSTQPALRPPTSPSSAPTTSASRPSSAPSRPSSASSSSRPSSPSSSSSGSPSSSSPSSIHDIGILTSVGFSLPPSSGVFEGNFTDFDNFGVSLAIETGNGPLFCIVQGDWYLFETQSILASIALGGQIANIFGVYAGAGLGVGFTDVDSGDTHFAWKAFAGVRLMFGEVFLLRADVSYVGDLGLAIGASVGWTYPWL